MEKEIYTYVNEEKKTVTTVLKVWGLYDCHHYMNDFSFITYEYKKFVGRAKCLPEDKFDIELGKKLSKARAYQKYDEAKLRCLWKKRDNMQRILDEIDADIEKQEAILDRTVKNRINLESELEG